MQDQPVLLALVAIIAGIFSMVGGMKNWDWFMNTFQAGIFVKTIGRQAARVVYSILGVVLIAIGVLLFMIG
ncbi:immunity 17 family protein [Paenibacillus pabuli]|uniref:immunity 17 family protein n=1 Tax=Paenibacillus pabuli TaxID=1472 RepID=UPI003242EF9E